jgi:APA family basic amino acid/polyamine antiporter
LSSITFCELAARLPSSGSAYSYAYVIYGELMAWIVGWNLNMRYGGSAAALSRAWTSYLVGLFKLIGIAIPTYFYNLNVYGF